MRSSVVRRAFATVVVVLASVAVIASGSNTAKKVDNNGKTTTAKNFKVGDLVKLGDWTVKVYAVHDPQPSVNIFSKPAAGSRWVSLDTEVSNLSKDPHTVSSALCFELQDSEHHTYNENITSAVVPGPPDGEVEPGGAKRGLVVFEIPQNAMGLSLHFKCDLLSSGTAIINVT